MAHGRANHYRFIGESGSAEGPTLEDAVRRLVDWWERTPSLDPNQMGNLIVRIEGEDTEISFEITDAKVLWEIRYDSPSAVIVHLAETMGLTVDQMRALVDQADNVVVEVNTIRDPANPDIWEPDASLDVKTNLDKGIPFLMSSLSRDPDRGGLEKSVEIGRRLQMQKAEISSHTGSPVEQISQFYPEAIKLSGSTKKKRVNYADRSKEIRRELKKGRSIKEASEKLSIPQSTLRGIRDRMQLSPIYLEAKGHLPGELWSKEAQRDFLRIAKKIGFDKASEKTGVPVRTAKRWIKK